MGVVCSAASAWLPLTTAAPTWDKAEAASELLSGAMVASEGSGGDISWLFRLAAPLMSGGCSAGHASGCPSALLRTTGGCETAVAGAAAGAVDMFAPSHPHRATEPTPTTANVLAATAALCNHIR